MTGLSQKQTIDQQLFSGQINGLVLTFSETERPLLGLAGLIDWRFKGMISQCIQSGVISGRAGECVYLPVTQNQKTYHLILVGSGPAKKPGVREPLPEESLKALKTNLAGLKLSQLGVSRADFGDVKEDYFSKYLKGISISVGD